MKEVPRKRQAVVPIHLRGERLDRVVTELLGEGSSRSKISRWIREGRLKLDGRTLQRPSQPVDGGEELQLQLPEPPVLVLPGLEPEILYQDDWLAILDKPPGLAMHGNYPGDPQPTVATFLTERFGPHLPTNQGAERPGIVHRLDRDTSGVCVVAFDQSVFMDLQEQFAERSVEKEYRALVYGKPRFQSDWIDRPLARDRKRPDRVRCVRHLGPGVRQALTYWQVEQRYQGFAHLKVLPKTGRTHQIRVHLSAVDLPLVGDPLYRAKNFGPGLLPPDSPPVERTLLHAHRLSFEHPERGERLDFAAPLAPDFTALDAFLGQRLPAEDEEWR
ncbi:MAG: RluA family pseudouridine synthase [Planctomycetota bacterium]|nr:MAG: RluA family pseudouridine synthase [Planctomycetota bacterium]